MTGSSLQTYKLQLHLFLSWKDKLFVKVNFSVMKEILLIFRNYSSRYFITLKSFEWMSSTMTKQIRHLALVLIKETGVVFFPIAIVDKSRITPFSLIFCSYTMYEYAGETLFQY